MHDRWQFSLQSDLHTFEPAPSTSRRTSNQSANHGKHPAECTHATYASHMLCMPNLRFHSSAGLLSVLAEVLQGTFDDTVLSSRLGIILDRLSISPLPEELHSRVRTLTITKIMLPSVLICRLCKAYEILHTYGPTLPWDFFVSLEKSFKARSMARFLRLGLASFSTEFGPKNWNRHVRSKEPLPAAVI